MILIVDDDNAIRTSLSFMLKRAGYDTRTAANSHEAIAIVREEAPQLILMDMNYSLSTDGEEGLTLLRQVKLFRQQVPVILMTAWGSIDLAVRGMKAGAFDFITKPWNNAMLMRRIETALELTGQRMSAPAPQARFDRSAIVGRSQALEELLDTVSRVAPTDASVLITGESGTGKELIAEAIHQGSPRAARPFVKVNLGGIAQSLFESEMFGHRKGAFTGAVDDRAGRFETADKGTIFLDEIGELDLTCQVKLLRVLQEQTFEPLGDSRPRKVDVRVVSATNADLSQLVDEHKFREDLYYRVNLITLHLPALRERREDIPLLVEHFARKLCQSRQMEPVEVTADAMNFLSRLPYPGNIRELKNLVERTILIAGTTRLEQRHFLSQVQPAPATAGTAADLTLGQIERNAIVKALEKYHGNLSLAATALGLSRQALYRKLEKFGIKT